MSEAIRLQYCRAYATFVGRARDVAHRRARDVGKKTSARRDVLWGSVMGAMETVQEHGFQLQKNMLR